MCVFRGSIYLLNPFLVPFLLVWTYPTYSFIQPISSDTNENIPLHDTECEKRASMRGCINVWCIICSTIFFFPLSWEQPQALLCFQTVFFFLKSSFFFFLDMLPPLWGFFRFCVSFSLITYILCHQHTHMQEGTVPNTWKYHLSFL